MHLGIYYGFQGFSYPRKRVSWAVFAQNLVFHLFCTSIHLLLFTSAMSDVLSAYQKAKIEWQLRLTTELASHYGNKMEAQEHEFVFCAEIPYALLGCGETS
jgi:hypothetical protein